MQLAPRKEGYLDRNLLDFVERDGVTGTVVELSRPRALMRGDVLSLLKPN